MRWAETFVTIMAEVTKGPRNFNGEMDMIYTIGGHTGVLLAYFIPIEAYISDEGSRRKRNLPCRMGTLVSYTPLNVE